MKTIEFKKDNLNSLKNPLFFKRLEENNLELDLENEFSNYASSENILATNNFTSALHLSMCAISLKRGDKVICSINSSPEIPEVVRHFDAEPIFIDIKKNSFEMDLDKLKQIIDENSSKKLKAIIVSHVAGEILNLKEVKKIIKDRKLLIIEDATNSIGLDREGLDSISDIKVFSFDNRISNLGIFATDNKVIFERAKLLADHGIRYEENAHLDYIYDVVDIGCQYEASRLDLAYSIDSLERVARDLKTRRDIAKQYVEHLKNTVHIKIDPFQQNHSYSQFIIRVDKNRDGFAKDLKAVGIETKLHYIPLHLLSYYKSKYELKINSYPNALRNYQEILSIPIHSMLSSEDVAYIIKNIKSIAKNRV